MSNVILAETTMEFSYNSTMGVFARTDVSPTFSLEANKEYEVVWDGTVYRRTAFPFTSFVDGSECVGVGNPLAAGMESTDDPFCVVFDSTNNYMQYLSLEQAATHTVAIYREVEAPGDNDSGDEILPEQELSGFISDTGSRASVTIVATSPLLLGRSYTVSWDGESYVCTAYDGAMAQLSGCVVIGNYNVAEWQSAGAVGQKPKNTEPFTIVYAPVEGGEMFMISCQDETCTDTTHTVGIRTTVGSVSIIVKDHAGNDVVYDGVMAIQVPMVGGGYKEFVSGETEDKSVEANFSGGDMEIKPSNGKLLNTVTVVKPETLRPENIAKDVEVAGVVGTHEGGGGGEDQVAIAEIIAGTFSGHYSNPNVTQIRSSAFMSLSTMTGATFINCSLVNLAAFSGCSSLAYISFPRCQSIGVGAFNNCYNLSEVDLPSCKRIATGAFSNCRSLARANLPVCESIGEHAFYYCSRLSEVNAPLAMKIEASAFRTCSLLTSVSFPLASTVGGYAFYQCPALSSIYIPKCESIGNYAFHTTQITEASFPECTTVGSSAFTLCSSLSFASFPECTTIGSYAFSGCKSLKTGYFPKVTTVGANAFSSCVALGGTAGMGVNFDNVTVTESSAFWNINGWTSLSFPKLSSIGTSTFAFNYFLTNVYLPNAQLIGSCAFYSCSRLETVSLPMCSSIYSSAFVYCSKLMSLYLLGSSYATMGSYTALMSTPMSTTGYTGAYGSIYVRESMLASYKTRTNWSRYSSRFVGLTDEQIAALEEA